MPYLGRGLEKGNYLKLDDISSQFDGSKTTFNLTVGGSAHVPGSSYSLLVSLSGIVQEGEAAYTLDQNEITFAAAPQAADDCFIISLGTPLGIGVPSNGTVNGTQLAKPLNYDNFFHLDHTNDRVGIGTSLPTQSLDVYDGNIAIRDPATDSQFLGFYHNRNVLKASIDKTGNNLTFENVDSGIIDYKIGGSSRVSIGSTGKIFFGTDDNTYFYRPGADTLAFVTAGTERLRIRSDGHIGIGTDVVNKLVSIKAVHPFLRLEASDSSDKRLDFQVSSSGIATISAEQSSQQLSFKTTGGEALRITSTGAIQNYYNANLPVTDSRPILQLGYGVIGDDSAGRNNVSTNAYPVNGNSTWHYIGSSSLKAARYDCGFGEHKWYTAVAGTRGNDITWSERLRITSDGEVGIGTDTPARVLHLHDDDSDTVQLHITNATTGATGSNGVSFALGSDESLIINQRESNHILLKTNDTDRVVIRSGGDVEFKNSVGIGTTNPTGNLMILSATPQIRLQSTDNANYAILRFVEDDHNGVNDKYIIGYNDSHSAQANQFSIKNQIGDITFHAGGVAVEDEKVRITSDGKVGVNQTTWANKDHMFEVNQSTNDKEIARFTNTGGIAGDVQGKGFIGLSAFNGTTYPHAYIGVEEAGNGNYQGHLTFATRNASSDSLPTERLRITSGGNLRLGLDSVANVTDSAHYIMTLTGKSGQSGAGAIAFRDPSANTDGFIFADSGNLFITADYSNATDHSSIRFRVDGSSEKMRITGIGSLGVGTNDPITPVHIKNLTAKETGTYSGGVNDTASVRIEDGGTTNGYYHGIELRSKRSGDCRLYVQDIGTNLNDFCLFNDNNGEFIESIRVKSNGQVGINTNSNLCGRVTINNNNGFDSASITSNTDNIFLTSKTASSSGAFGASIGFSRVQYPDRRAAAIVVRQDGTDEDKVGLSFFTHPSTDATASIVEQFRLASNGDAFFAEGIYFAGSQAGISNDQGRLNVLGADVYGTDVQHGTTVVLTNEQGQTTQAMILGDTSGGQDGNVLWAVSVNNTTNDPTTGSESGWSEKARVEGNGDFVHAGSHSASGSDDRLKKNKVGITSALSKVCAMEGFTYEWNDVAEKVGMADGDKHLGLSAQTVEPLVPEVVVVNDMLINPDDGTNDYKTIRYERLVPLLVEAIKDLKTENDSLKTRISALEGS